jgi:hypothetical protein
MHEDFMSHYRLLDRTFLEAVSTQESMVANGQKRTRQWLLLERSLSFR